MEFEEPSADHLKILEKYFGHKQFKKAQWNIIRAVMYDKRDCCVIASTGFGKSLIYQFPAVFLNKLAVVISPLIALMQDQVLSLKNKGVKACFFGSQQHDKSLQMSDHNVVYITPEYYELGRGKLQLKEAEHNIILFAVDEAHVMDQWGKQFRPYYTRLNWIRELHPTVPIVALTATAPDYVKDDIIKTLKLHNHVFLKTALDRPNLEFMVRKKTSGSMVDLLPYLRNIKQGSAIVYCLARRHTEDISESLNSYGILAKPYHAGLDMDIRRQTVEDFRSNKLRFVVCTIAFGMGVDKPDVRLVLHYGIPKSIEAYYQEAGRAGRDGNPSKCVLFWGPDDLEIHHMFIEQKDKKIIKTEEQKQIQRNLLNLMVQFANSRQCRRLTMLNYLGTTDIELLKITIHEKCCDNCKQDLFYKVPPKLQYKNINEDGKFDFTNDARFIFQAVHRKLSKNDIVNLLLGEPPRKQDVSYYNLKACGSGKSKTKVWWESLLSLLVSKRYLEVVGNCFRTNNLSKQILRFHGVRIFLEPPSHILDMMDKIDDIELFWDKGVIKSRPVAQPLDVITRDTQEGKNSSIALQPFSFKRVISTVDSESSKILDQSDIDSLIDLDFDDNDEADFIETLLHKRKLSVEALWGESSRKVLKYEP